MNIYQTPESKHAADELDFNQDDLASLLHDYDPRNPRQLGKPRGITKKNFAAIPGREDVFLRWTTPTAGTFPNFRNATDLAEHLNTYERRLGNLVASGLIHTPRYSYFGVYRCPRHIQPVAYAVVEYANVSPLKQSKDAERIAQVGNFLLDDILDTPPPHMEDHTEIRQWGIDDAGRTLLLDLDAYLIREARTIIGPLAAWGQLARPYDDGALARRVGEAHLAAHMEPSAAPSPMYLQLAEGQA